MPKYEFECQLCKTRFERTMKMGDHPTHECPSCGDEAPRLFSGTGFGFGFAPGGSAPANSGVHDQDYPTADKVVGRSSEERWNTYRNRDLVKKEVRRVGGSQAISRVDGEGYVDYSTMSPPEVEARGRLVDYAVKVEKQPEVKVGQ
jgi:putative FmdB family regulatory protein